MWDGSLTRGSGEDSRQSGTVHLPSRPSATDDFARGVAAYIAAAAAGNREEAVAARSVGRDGCPLAARWRVAAGRKVKKDRREKSIIAAEFA